MIGIRRARGADAVAIGAVHVAAWRSAYPGILPDDYLARLSAAREAAYYEAAILDRSAIVHVAVASGMDAPPGAGPRIIGFTTAGRARVRGATGASFADGEVATLYVLDDWRERGVGRRLLRAAAAALADSGHRGVFLWVLRDNPSRWFYERLGGKAVAETGIQVGGRKLVQTAFVWDPIERLIEETARAR